MALTYRVNVSKELKKKLTKGIDLTEPMKEMAIYLEDQYKIAFHKQGRGKKWLPRSVPNTAGIIEDFKFSRPILSRRFSPRDALVDTGRLRENVGTKIKGNTIFWGTNVPYAKIHQEGGIATITNPIPEQHANSPMDVDKKLQKVKKKFPGEYRALIRTKKFTIRIPQRKFLEILEKDKKHFIDIIKRQMKGQ